MMGKAEEGTLINITIQGGDCYCPSCMQGIDLAAVKVRRLIIEFECAHCEQGCFIQTDEFVFFGGKH